MDKELLDFLKLMMGIDFDEDPNQSYDEIKKLDKMLADADINHLISEGFGGGFQIIYFGRKGPNKNYDNGICSIIQTPISIGHENNLLEISGLLTQEELQLNTVKGNLSAEEVFQRIKNHWDNDTLIEEDNSTDDIDKKPNNNSGEETEKYKEIRKLDKMLTEADIPHVFTTNFDGFQILYYGRKEIPQSEENSRIGKGLFSVCSVVENCGTYGGKSDLLEISGLLTEEERKIDSVKGFLSAENVFQRIKNHWDNE